MDKAKIIYQNLVGRMISLLNIIHNWITGRKPETVNREDKKVNKKTSQENTEQTTCENMANKEQSNTADREKREIGQTKPETGTN